MKTVSPYLSIIALNVNGLNIPIKRHKEAEWIKKQDPIMSCVKDTHFRFKDTCKLKIKGQRKYIPCKW